MVSGGQVESFTDSGLISKLRQVGQDMLGKKVGELHASTTTKILPTEGSTPRFETSVEGSGTLLGVDINWLATYWVEMNANGTLYGECPNQGVIMCGDGIGTFK